MLGDHGISVNPEHHTPVIFLRRKLPEMEDFRGERFCHSLPLSNAVPVDHTKTQVVIVIDVIKAAKEGIKFFRRITQEIVTPGDERGRIGPQFFKYVMVRRWSKDVLLHPVSEPRGLLTRVQE